jgi:hypothetical protein
MVLIICILLFTKSYYDYQIREGVMGGAHSTHGGDERLHKFGVKTQREETAWKQ